MLERATRAAQRALRAVHADAHSRVGAVRPPTSSAQLRVVGASSTDSHESVAGLSPPRSNESGGGVSHCASPSDGLQAVVRMRADATFGPGSTNPGKSAWGVGGAADRCGSESADGSGSVAPAVPEPTHVSISPIVQDRGAAASIMLHLREAAARAERPSLAGSERPHAAVSDSLRETQQRLAAALQHAVAALAQSESGEHQRQQQHSTTGADGAANSPQPPPPPPRPTPVPPEAATAPSPAAPDEKRPVAVASAAPISAGWKQQSPAARELFSRFEAILAASRGRDGAMQRGASPLLSSLGTDTGVTERRSEQAGRELRQEISLEPLPSVHTPLPAERAMGASKSVHGGETSVHAADGEQWRRQPATTTEGVLSAHDAVGPLGGTAGHAPADHSTCAPHSGPCSTRLLLPGAGRECNREPPTPDMLQGSPLLRARVATELPGASAAGADCGPAAAASGQRHDRLGTQWPPWRPRRDALLSARRDGSASRCGTALLEQNSVAAARSHAARAACPVTESRRARSQSPRGVLCRSSKPAAGTSARHARFGARSVSPDAIGQPCHGARVGEDVSTSRAWGWQHGGFRRGHPPARAPGSKDPAPFVSAAAPCTPQWQPAADGGAGALRSAARAAADCTTGRGANASAGTAQASSHKQHSSCRPQPRLSVYQAVLSSLRAADSTTPLAA